ncbi:hypothetical protein QTO34_013742 [Cnephaeus nilssonii]|uniref:Uncharacterized protein n=1 Tax=Cnephaeus nilssonii TaxID=3371016 RepID=A0AA40I8G3_CNENI|nr:hypothetical protein QTO34_013742 [Eptesicus nilssonii]
MLQLLPGHPSTLPGPAWLGLSSLEALTRAGPRQRRASAFQYLMKKCSVTIGRNSLQGLDSLADSSSISWCHLEIFMLLGCGYGRAPSPPLLQPGRPSGQQQLLPALPWQERRVLKRHVPEAWEHKHQEKFTAVHGEEGEEAGGA